MNLDDYEFQKPGRIVEYFPETQTATIKISNDRTYDTVEETESQSERGLLYDVPVFTPSGGGWSMTFPIQAGEPCLLSFSEFGYDHWFADNKDAAGVRADGHPQPWTRRKFNLADGFAQVGFNNLMTAISEYSGVNSEWRNADRTQRIELWENGSIRIRATDDNTIHMHPSGPGNGIKLESTTRVRIVAPTVEITGDLSVTGTITSDTSVAAPSVLANGKELAGHDHTITGGSSAGTTGANN